MTETRGCSLSSPGEHHGSLRRHFDVEVEFLQALPDVRYLAIRMVFHDDALDSSQRVLVDAREHLIFCAFAIDLQTITPIDTIQPEDIAQRRTLRLHSRHVRSSRPGRVDRRERGRGTSVADHVEFDLTRGARYRKTVRAHPLFKPVQRVCEIGRAHV